MFLWRPAVIIVVAVVLAAARFVVDRPVATVAVARWQAVHGNNPRHKGNNCRCHNIHYWQVVQAFQSTSSLFRLLAC
jgi:hypothetical protein